MERKRVREGEALTAAKRGTGECGDTAGEEVKEYPEAAERYSADTVSDATSRSSLQRRFSAFQLRESALRQAAVNTENNASLVLSLLAHSQWDSIKTSFVTDLSEQFLAAKQRHTALRRLVAEEEQRLEAVESERSAALQLYAASAKSQRAEIAALSSARQAAADKLKREIDVLKSQAENYRKLSGVELASKEDGALRCRVKVQRNEMILRLLDSSEGVEVSPVSYTVPAEKVPDCLKQEVVLERGQEAVLLHKVVSSLV